MTAVELLMQTLEQNNIIDLDLVDSDKYYTIIEQAKQMEKKQMEESFAEGYKSGITDYMDIQNGYDGRAIDFPQYYNEKYGNELVQKMQQFGKTEQLKKRLI